jgi:hypothetical protein
LAVTLVGRRQHRKKNLQAGRVQAKQQQQQTLLVLTQGHSKTQHHKKQQQQQQQQQWHVRTCSGSNSGGGGGRRLCNICRPSNSRAHAATQAAWLVQDVRADGWY